MMGRAPCFLESSPGFLISGGEQVAVMDARFLHIIDNRGVPSDNNASGLDAYLKAFDSFSGRSKSSGAKLSPVTKGTGQWTAFEGKI